MNDRIFSDKLPPLSKDILKGASEIAEFIGENRRRVFYLCETQQIPAFKIGAIWHARRSALNRHYGGEAAQ